MASVLHTGTSNLQKTAFGGVLGRCWNYAEHDQTVQSASDYLSDLPLPVTPRVEVRKAKPTPSETSERLQLYESTRTLRAN